MGFKNKYILNVDYAKVPSTELVVINKVFKTEAIFQKVSDKKDQWIFTIKFPPGTLGLHPEEIHWFLSRNGNDPKPSWTMTPYQTVNDSGNGTITALQIDCRTNEIIYFKVENVSLEPNGTIMDTLQAIGF